MMTTTFFKTMVHPALALNKHKHDVIAEKCSP